MKRRIILLAVCLLLISATGAFPASLLNIYELKFPTNGFYKKSDPAKSGKKAPKGARFKIIKEVDTWNDKLIYLEFIKPVSQDPAYVSDDDIYIIEKSILEERYKPAFGDSFGLLLIPYKYRPGDGSLTTDPTFGGYWGLSNRWLGFNSTFLVGVGVSHIVTTDGNTNQIEYKTALTAGGGLTSTIRGKYHAGIFAGIDRLGGEAGRWWKYENELWISLTIGYNFAQ